MAEAISNTSPLLYLHRIDRIQWLQSMFGSVWVSDAVVLELAQGKDRGYDVPTVGQYAWIRRDEPRSMPSEWLSLDLGPGELATMSLALDHPERIVLLDDGLARRVAHAAGLTVWGTLRVVLEAKKSGFIGAVAPVLTQLSGTGMWMSQDIQERILKLAWEK